MKIHIKRIYESAAPDDGYRVLVDRLWPRGVSKEHAKLDEWLREVAPSSALRCWFGHDPTRWMEFKRRYFAELNEDSYAIVVTHLRSLAAHQQITLLYGAKDEVHNQAVALKEYLSVSK